MKVITKGSVVRISFFITFTFLLLAAITLPLDYKAIEIIKSPDNNFKACHVDSRSEAGAAPYGTHIFISSWWQPFPQFYLEPVFAGYCVPKIKWESPHVLTVEAEVKKPENIVVNKTSYRGIQIKYNITTKNI